MSQSRSVCFLTEPKLSFVDRLLPLLWLKSCQKRLSLPEEPSSNSIVMKDPILLVRCFDKSVLFGQFYNIFTAFMTLNSQAQLNVLTAFLGFKWQNLQRSSKYLGQKLAIDPFKSQIHLFWVEKMLKKKKIFLQPHWKSPYQVLSSCNPCAAKLLDTCVTFIYLF